jgi:hypothetical protein
MLANQHDAPTGNSPRNGFIPILVQLRQLQILA